MRLTTLLFILLISFDLTGQDAGNYINQVNNYNTLSSGVDQFDYIYKKAPEYPGIIGSPYWYNSDMQGSFFLRGKNYSSRFMKYDVLHNQLEVAEQGQVKILHAAKVDSFMFLDVAEELTRTFVKPSLFSKYIIWDGFVEVIERGTVSLFKRHEAILKDPTYDPALMVGNKDREIIMKKEFYLCKAGNCYQIRKKKDVKTFLTEVGYPYRDHQIDPGSEPELRQLVRTLNNRKD